MKASISRTRETSACRSFCRIPNTAGAPPWLPTMMSVHSPLGGYLNNMANTIFSSSSSGIMVSNRGTNGTSVAATSRRMASWTCPGRVDT
jgi:hypothetical protein